MPKVKGCVASLLVVLLVVSEARAQSQLAPGGIIDPRLVGRTDPTYAPTFFIGQLALRIPNSFLVFPWRTGTHPFDRSVCERGKIVNDAVVEATCRSDHQSVFLKIPVPDGPSDNRNGNQISNVIFGYHEMVGSLWLDYRRSVEDYGSEHDERWTRGRVPKLDTANYVAFHDTWTGKYAENAPPKILAMSAGSFLLLSRDIDYRPRALNCETVTSDGAKLEGLRCSATIDFLQKEYPVEASGRHQYSINFDLPGTEVDSAAQVGLLVSKAIADFLIPTTDTK